MQLSDNVNRDLRSLFLLVWSEVSETYYVCIEMSISREFMDWKNVFVVKDFHSTRQEAEK